MYLTNLISSKYFLGIILSLTVVLHLPFLNLPPKSMHLWRQCNTLAMARNFYQEEMNPFHPRVDNRFDQSGITGSQFPSFEFGLASLYHITGEHYWVQRSYCLLLHLLGIVGMFFLSNRLVENKAFANLTAWTYAWSPMLFYYGITALPDDLALPSSIWGMFFFFKWFHSWIEQNRSSLVWMLMSLFFITLAGLTKIQYLALGFFLFAYVWLQKEKYQMKHWLVFGSFGAFCSVVSVLWYLYARWLIEKSGLTDFGLVFKPESDLTKAAGILVSNITQSLPELILNYSSCVLFLCGIFLFFKKPKKKHLVLIPFMAWSCCFATYHLIELKVIEHHDYYMMAYLPLLVFISAYGAYRLLNSRWSGLALVLVVLQPVLASARIVPSRFLAEEEEDKRIFYKKDSLEKLQNCVPHDALCIVGSDDSHCIYFYFLNKKGFGFAAEEGGITAERMKEYVEKGAKFLYCNQPQWITDPSVTPFLDNLVCKEANFYVYSLKTASE